MTPSRGRSHEYKLRAAYLLRRASRIGRLDRLLRRFGMTRVVEERLLRSVFSDERTRVRIHTRGFDLELPGSSAQGYLHDRYEPRSLAWLEEQATAAEHCADIGAHIGLTTLVMARAAAPDGFVIACEPASATCHVLMANVTRNRVTNVQVLNVACGRTGGQATLSVQPQSERSSISSPGEHSGRREVVRMERLEDLLPTGVGSFDLIKIDVEGHELDVLAGAGRAVDPARTSLLVEWNPGAQEAAGLDPIRLPQYLTDLGYEIDVIDDAGTVVEPLEEVLMRFRAAGAPHDWYVNLACARTTR